jgi:ribose 5-phosphate isomerase B
MKIFIGSDHRGFSQKNKLIDYLSSHHEVVDCGDTQLDPNDDYPDYAKLVASSIVNDPSSLGIVICGSGVGVCIAANKVKGIRCGLGFDVEQIKHARENDHINVLALSSDYLDFEKNKVIVETFLNSQEKNEDRFLRRINKIDNI